MDIRNMIIECMNELGIDTSDINNNIDADLKEYLTDSILFINFVVNLEEKMNKEIPEDLLAYEHIGSLNGFISMLEE